jgi:coenzyme F420-reducing hydrogenase gamma subunit
MTAAVYASPDMIETLKKSTPIADHVFVDYELRGCPISKQQLVSVLACLLNNVKPVFPNYSVCVECKMKGNVCGLVTHGPPCLGPVTQAGCGALCPTYHRGCYGCFGPKESPNTHSLANAWLSAGMSRKDLMLLFRSFNASSEAFRKESEHHEIPHDQR